MSHLRFHLRFPEEKIKEPVLCRINREFPKVDTNIRRADVRETTGWIDVEFAGELHVPIVDEHYYQSPQWFWDNLNRYDNYDRTKSKVYLGEYAAHEENRRPTLRSAFAEAAWALQGRAVPRGAGAERFAAPHDSGTIPPAG